MLTQRQIDIRITHNPEVLGGKAIISGTRLAVELIVDFTRNGMSLAELLADYPELTREDVEAALAFAEQEAERTEVRAW